MLLYAKNTFYFSVVEHAVINLTVCIYDWFQNNNWNGELSPAARNILLQHAIQGDISDLQQATIKWLAYSRIPTMDPKVLLSHLLHLEEMWGSEALSREEVRIQSE